MHGPRTAHITLLDLINLIMFGEEITPNYVAPYYAISPVPR
jgi:hypothetical protein